MARVSAENFAEALLGALSEYSEAASEATFRAVDAVTQETDAEIRRHITFTQRTKKYVKAFRTKTSFQDKRNKRNTWYVASPYYRLTHLLENGHKTRGGGDSRKFPHIKYGEELARRRLPELITKEIEEIEKNG
ncbi:MAG: hypothetical protein IKQ10_02005 [Oscillospiraceae bacterium]|nr:hypothetical protein [Oscillospiraceae bacterium]